MFCLVRTLAAALAILIALAPTHALGRTIVYSLGAEPLMIGHILSASDLAYQSRVYKSTLALAAQKLGLTHREFQLIYRRIQEHRLELVTVPRHIDAMTWRRGTRVLSNNDLIIPANTPGWEIDLPRFGSIVRVFLPSTCGNLSLVVQPEVAVEAFTVHFKQPTPKAVLPEFNLPPPNFAPSAVPLPATASEVPTLTALMPPAPPGRHYGWLPFLAPILIGVIHGGGGGGGGAVRPPPVGPTPPPGTYVCFEDPIYHCDRKGP